MQQAKLISQDNTNITGNLDVTGNVTVRGNITIGDEDTDSIEFGAEVDSNIVPNVDGTFNLGATPKDGKMYTVTIDPNGTFIIAGNKIETIDTNSDLHLDAAGTGPNSSKQ